MKLYHRILSIAGGLSLLTLLTFGTTTALLTDKDQGEVIVIVPGETVDIALTVRGITGNTIDAVSGQTFEINPVITNSGTADVYAFLEIDVPYLGDTPVITYTADDSVWNLIDTETTDEYQKSVYSYGHMSVLDAGTDTTEHPLLETAAFGNIRSEEDKQLALVIKAYAATDLGFDGEPEELDPFAVWTTTLANTGE